MESVNLTEWDVPLKNSVGYLDVKLSKIVWEFRNVTPRTS